MKRASHSAAMASSASWAVLSPFRKAWYSRVKGSYWKRVGSLASLPLEETGGPFFEAFLPRYRSQLELAGLVPAMEMLSGVAVSDTE